MNLLHALSMLALAAGGLGVGALVARVVPGVPASAIQLAFAAVAVLTCTSPLWRALGWFPPLPPRPRGHMHAWRSTSVAQEGSVRLECAECGVALRYHTGVVEYLEPGDVVAARYRLLWPGFLGRWRRIELSAERP